MRRLLPLLLCLCLLPAGCRSSPPPEDGETLHILATTYPVWLLTTAVTEGAEGVEVTRLIGGEVSCLHDYTLTVPDMKAIEKANVIVMNGAGLEAFMADALARSGAAAIDCSTGVELLPAAGHEDHHHDHDHSHDHGHYDPHFWLSGQAALTMLDNIAQGLSQLDDGRRDTYAANRLRAAAQLSGAPSHDLSQLSCPYLITFHDGFQYLARENGLTLLKSIEEEQGSTASAAEIREIVALIEEYRIPAIFTEKNGSDATARVIARETGAAVYQLDMLMGGEGRELTAYIDAMNVNMQTIAEALK